MSIKTATMIQGNEANYQQIALFYFRWCVVVCRNV